MHSKNVHPNKITYTVMIGGYARDGNVTEASRLLNEMREKGIVPDSITYKEFIYGYLKQGGVLEAFKGSDEENYAAIIEGWNKLIQ
jgi:pentatricopeptide repeat protein